MEAFFQRNGDDSQNIIVEVIGELIKSSLSLAKQKSQFLHGKYLGIYAT